MLDSSLPERIKNQLEQDLRQTPPAFIRYRDLPFAIFRYDPPDEWLLRGEIRRLQTRLAQVGKQVTLISFADLLWDAIDQAEGIDAIAQFEREHDFLRAQEQVNTYLSSADWAPLADTLARKLEPLDPQREVVFLWRAAAMGPDIFPMSTLLELLYEHRLEVPSVLFYPGTAEQNGTGLRFLDLPGRNPSPNYRVKIYY